MIWIQPLLNIAASEKSKDSNKRRECKKIKPSLNIKDKANKESGILNSFQKTPMLLKL
jgi:hypothetical protein